MSLYDDNILRRSRAGGPYSGIAKFGTNPSVGTSFETIWLGGGIYTFLQTAETVRVASGGNANDTAAGSGARQIEVQGLDENWLEVRETLTLAGTSASAASTTTFIRVFRAVVTAVGTYGGDNAGTIVIEGTSSSTTLASIDTGYAQTQLALYSIPADRWGYLTSVALQPDTSKATEGRVRLRLNGDITSGNMSATRTIDAIVPTDNNYRQDYTASYVVLPPKSDISIEAKVTSGSGAVSAEFGIILFAKRIGQKYREIT